MTRTRIDRTTSLRFRWNRATAFLIGIIAVCGLANVLGTRTLVGTFRDSAVRVESEATNSAELKADIVDHAVIVASAISEGQQRDVGEAEAAIRGGFATMLGSENTAEARAIVVQSQTEWEALVRAAGPGADLETRGTAVSTRAPAVLALLDQAGAANRQSVRADLADAEDVERFAIAVLVLLQVLAIWLAVRMARRLSHEVLLPVGKLRDSANHLAAGELDHRVVVDRADELGELAASFNSMADAIAGSQRSLTYEANTDSLSGVANRSAFAARLSAALARPERRSGDQAVLFVDLDDFKDVNDTLGHAAGDEMLRVVAQRLGTTTRPGDLVARLGGDEFALLLDGLVDADVAREVADRVVVALAEPMDIGPHRLRIGASVGLAIRTSESTPEQLMREADVAMYAAKAKGKNRVERYDAGLDDVTMARHMLRVDLGSAIERDELVIDYQPVVDLHTGAIRGLEALVRWQHPIRGLLPPSAFIDLAEETGAIIDIGSWVLETSARQLVAWQESTGHADLWMSVNVSMLQLDARGFADQVTFLLNATGLNPRNLVLEVTESLLVDPDGEAAAALVVLRKLGVRIALDDFGTGYSSINYLRELPVDIIKVDRSFTIDTQPGGAGMALLEAIVAMAHHLQLDIIPEGIEDDDQLMRLRALGCRIGQGFLLSRPLGADAVGALLHVPCIDEHRFAARTNA